MSQLRYDLRNKFMLDLLPTEVLAMLVHRMEVHDVLSLSRTSAAMKELLAGLPFLLRAQWRLHPRPSRWPAVEIFLRRHEGLLSLELDARRVPSLAIPGRRTRDVLDGLFRDTVRHFSLLTQLRMYGLGEMVDFNLLPPLVKTLVFENCNLTMTDMVISPNGEPLLPFLENAHFINCTGLRSSGFLARLPSVKVLTIRDTRPPGLMVFQVRGDRSEITVLDVSRSTMLPQYLEDVLVSESGTLTELYCEEADIAKALPLRCARLPALERASFAGSRNLHVDTFVYGFATRNMPKLRELNLSGSNLTEDEVQEVRDSLPRVLVIHSAEFRASERAYDLKLGF